MSNEILAMKGKLADLEQQDYRLRLKAEGLSDTIRQGLNYNLVPVSEMEIARTAALMDDLVVTQGEMLAVRLQMDRLKRELGNG